MFALHSSGRHAEMPAEINRSFPGAFQEEKAAQLLPAHVTDHSLIGHLRSALKVPTEESAPMS
jgi:hypothetical protein